jgi:hypothetical protein
MDAMSLLRGVLAGTFLGLLALSAAAQSLPDLSGKDPHWIQDRDKQCWAANPDPAENETIAWTGGCENHVLSGEGTLTWYLNGAIVGRDIGTFMNGQLSGKGAIVFSDGARYDGDFPGYGVLTAPDGRKFPAQSVQELAGWSVEQVNPNEAPNPER